MEWKLTDQEIASINARGADIEKAQKAKRQAYIGAGGIILNPDALEDLYGACKKAKQWDGAPGVKFPIYVMQQIEQAIARAEEV